MKKLLSAVLAALCVTLAGPPALAQVPQAYQAQVNNRTVIVPVTAANPLPVSATVTATASIAAFAPTGNATLSLTTASARVALGSADPTAIVTNTGSVVAYVKFGSSSVTAATTDTPIQPAQSIAFNVGSNTYIAGITASSTSALTVTTGTGLPAIAGGGSGGGGGGGAVTIASGANVVEGSTSDTSSSATMYGALLAIKAAAQDTTTPSPVKTDQTTHGTTDLVAADITKVAGAAVATGHGTASGALRVELPTDGTGKVVVAGDVAAGTTDSGNSVKTGGLAKTADPTAVADAQRVDDLHDPLGKKVVIPALRGQKGVQQTAITSSTSETTIVTAAGASIFADLYGLVVTNTSATDACLTIKDATAGTTRLVVCAKAGETSGFTVDAGSATPQAAANNNWTATSSASISAWQITTMFVKTKA